MTMGYPLGVSGVGSATFTPAAASHTNGDVTGGVQEIKHMGTPGARVVIQSASMLIKGGTIETTAWALHLFDAVPTTIADDAAFDIASADMDLYQGFVTIPQVVDYGAALWIESHNIGKMVRLKGTSLWGYLVNGTTLTPAAVAHVVKLGWFAR
jgi:hypothetical protein